MGAKLIRPLVFAGLMSCSTAMLVSAAILFIHGVSNQDFFAIWIKSVFLAWPLVFVSIMTIAPLINKLLDKVFRAQ